MATEPTPKFVVFGDMLGFGELVLDNPDTTTAQLRELSVEWRPRDPGFKLSSASIEDAYEGMPGPSLDRQFTNFHRVLGDRFDAAGFRHDAVIFSDSFFFATDDRDGLLTFLPQLMADMILNLVPIRLGVAEGAFCLNEMKTALKSASHLFSVQFLGKGVVRAVKAESCGLGGVRIALHPSAIKGLDIKSPLVLPIQESKKPDQCAHEFNYHAQFLGDLTQADTLAEMRAGIQKMGAVAPPDMNERHYAATLAAYERFSIEWRAALSQRDL